MHLCLSIPASSAEETAHNRQDILRSFAEQPIARRMQPALRCSLAELVAQESREVTALLDALSAARGVLQCVCTGDLQQQVHRLESVLKQTGVTRTNLPPIVLGFALPHAHSLDAEVLASLNRIAQGCQVFIDVAGPRPEMQKRISEILQLPNRRLHIAIDTASYLIGNPTSSVEVMLQRNIHQLGALILRDAPPEVSGNPPGQPLPLGGDGLIDHARVAQILRDVAFAGPCILDLRPNLDGSIDGSDRKEKSEHPHFADAMQHLEICGWFGR